MMKTVLFNNVTRHYQRGDEVVHALDDVSFEVDAGKMIALVGPSGCGKSTCLNLISGVDRPDSGEVHVCGVHLVAAQEEALIRHRRTSIGIVFQAFYLMPHLTVEENIALPLSLCGVRDSQRVSDLIERVGLKHRAGHYPSELSGGEQQRTAVARALVNRPAVLVADEPTGNLDQHSGAMVLDLMNTLRKEEGTTLILATHDLTIAESADRVIHIRDGKIEQIACT